MSTNINIPHNIQRSKAFLKKALSVWATKGFDIRSSEYVEALNFEGEPLYDLDRRFRIQARTIFAHTAGYLWGYCDEYDNPEKVFDHIIKTYWLTQGGFATLVDKNGNMIDSTIKTYDHAFVMLALGWLYKKTQKPLHKEWLLRTWDTINTRLAHSQGGFITGIPHAPDAPALEQNPHMHMLESMLSLFELFGEDVWKDAAKMLYRLFTTHFAKTQEGKLREFFTEQWDPDPQKGKSLEPGHHYEWVWLLHKYENLIQEPVPMIFPLFKFALKGSNSIGLGYDETDFDGNPIRSTHRIWVQTEVLKARVSMYQKTQDNTHLIHAHHAWELLFKYYLIEEKGIWHDQIDDNLQNVSRNAPTSILYHLVIALHEYIILCNSL